MRLEKLVLQWNAIVFHAQISWDYRIEGWVRIELRTFRDQAPLPGAIDGYLKLEADVDTIRSAGGAGTYVLAQLNGFSDTVGYKRALAAWNQHDLFG